MVNGRLESPVSKSQFGGVTTVEGCGRGSSGCGEKKMKTYACIHCPFGSHWKVWAFLHTHKWHPWHKTGWHQVAVFHNPKIWSATV